MFDLQKIVKNSALLFKILSVDLALGFKLFWFVICLNLGKFQKNSEWEKQWSMKYAHYNSKACRELSLYWYKEGNSKLNVRTYLKLFNFFTDSTWVGVKLR